MIKNECEYRITKSQAEKFKQALAVLSATGGDPRLHPVVQKAQREAVQSKLEDLQGQIAEYEALQSGKVSVVSLDSLEERPSQEPGPPAGGGFSGVAMDQPGETFRDEGEEVIEEIRAVRHRISERFDHDPARLMAYYREKQERHRERLLRPESRSEPSGKTSRG